MAGQIPDDSFAGSLSDPGIDPFEIPEVPEPPVTPAGQARTSAKPVPGPISPDRKLPPENLYSRMRSNVINALGMNNPILNTPVPNPAYSPRVAQAAGAISQGLGALDKAIPPEATMIGSMFPANLAEAPLWGAAKFAKGVTEYQPWRQEMMADADPSIDRDLPWIWDESKKVFDKHVAKASLDELGEHHLPNLSNVVDQYNKGIEGQDWYLNTRPELERQFGPDSDLFINMLAATSPNATVPANMSLALKAYKAYKNGLTDFREFSDNPAHPGFMKPVIDNLNHVIRNEPISGQKIINFAKNLRGETEPVTVDRWMMRALGMPHAGLTANTYKFADYWLSQVAHDMGVEPRQLQAAVWKTAREVGGQSAATGQPFEAMLAKKLAKDPDLGALLNRVRQAAPPPVPRPTRQQIMAPLYARGGLARFQSGGIVGEGPMSPAINAEERGMRMAPPPVKSQEDYQTWLRANWQTLEDQYLQANPKGNLAGFEQWLPTPPNSDPAVWKERRAQWLNRFQGKAKNWPLPSTQSPEVEVRTTTETPTQQQNWLDKAADIAWKREINKPIQQQEHQAKSLAPGMSPLTKDYPPELSPYAVERDDELGRLRGYPNIPPGPVPGAPPVKSYTSPGPPTISQGPPGYMPGTFPIPDPEPPPGFEYPDPSDPTLHKATGGTVIDGGWYGQNSPSPVRMQSGGWWQDIKNAWNDPNVVPNPAYGTPGERTTNAQKIFGPLLGGKINSVAQGAIDPVITTLQLANRAIPGKNQEAVDERLRNYREQYKQSLPGGKEDWTNQTLRFLSSGVTAGEMVPEIKIPGVGKNLPGIYGKIAPWVTSKLFSGAPSGAMYGALVPKESPNTLRESAGQVLGGIAGGVGEEFLGPPIERGIAALITKFGASPQTAAKIAEQTTWRASDALPDPSVPGVRVPSGVEHEAEAEAATLAAQEANPVAHAVARRITHAAGDTFDPANFTNKMTTQQQWQPPSPPAPLTPDQQNYDLLSDPLLSSGEPYAGGGLYGQMRRASLRALHKSAR